MPERAKILVQSGVTAATVTAKDRTTLELRQKIRRMVERRIVSLDMIAEREHLQSDDIDMLAKLNRLLTDLENKSGSFDPEKASDEELAAAAKGK